MVEHLHMHKVLVQSPALQIKKKKDKFVLIPIGIQMKFSWNLALWLRSLAENNRDKIVSKYSKVKFI
jgi:hypothetical protein